MDRVLIGERTAARGDIARAQPGVRVRTLLGLRWIAILGQCVALLVVTRMFGPLAQRDWILLTIGFAVVTNGVCRILYPVNSFLSGRQAAVQLALDLGQLSVLLALTGGLTNPFAILMLVPVTISATLLSLRATAVLFLFAVFCMSFIALFSYPLPWPQHSSTMHDALIVPDLYRVGEWMAMLVSMAFLCAYAWRVSAEARRRQHALITTQAALARAQQMSALGSLAAAAAHELGTPLGTMTLVVRDLESQLHNDPDFGADIALLKEQLTRCRDLLAGISRRTSAEDHFPIVSLPAILHEVCEAHAHGRVGVVVDLAPSVAQVDVKSTPELRNGLENVIANAVRHARHTVRVTAERVRTTVCVRISDDGPGFADTVLPHLGEPDLSKHDLYGLGLGIFIAQTVFERIGAKVRFFNQGGAVVEIIWHHTEQPV